MRQRIVLVIVFAFSLMLHSCYKHNEYSIIPEIEFEQMNYIDGYAYDTLDIVIRFTDGDGDIGFTQGDTLPPFNRDDSVYNYYYFNLHFYTYHYVDTAWVLYEFEDPYADGSYRIKDITPRGQDKSLNGTIQAGIRLSPAMPDSIFYEIELVDRALHISNRVQTPVIVK